MGQGVQDDARRGPDAAEPQAGRRGGAARAAGEGEEGARRAAAGDRRGPRPGPHAHPEGNGRPPADHPDRRRRLRPAGAAGDPLPAGGPRRRRRPGAELPPAVRRLRPGRDGQGPQRPAGRGAVGRRGLSGAAPAVTGYRRRQLDQILDWLPREKLYSIPRSLQTNGSRALGRLAFCDNYLRFVTRFRREVQVATHPESMSQSADQTGLPPRDAIPQVYVFASAAGGSGGMLLDVGYAVRRVLSRLNAADSPVTAFVYAARRPTRTAATGSWRTCTPRSRSSTTTPTRT